MKVERIILKIFRAALIIFIALNQSLPAQSHHLQFEHLTISDGLSNNTVHSIFQDSYGFMWFGTEGGLNRYDGYNFTYYKHAPDDSCSISGTSIMVIFEDSRQDLWVGTFESGLNLYDREGDRFIRITTEFFPENSRTLSIIRSIYEDRQGQLWIGSDTGLFKYHRESQKFIPVFNPDEYNFDVFSIYEDHNQQFWIGTDVGLFLLDRETMQIIPYLNNQNSIITEEFSSIRAIHETTDGIIWVGTYSGGLFRIDPKSRQIKNFVYDERNKNSLPSNSIFCVASDDTDNLYLGSENGGFIIFNRKTEKFSHHAFNLADENSLNSNSVYSMFLSPNEILWLGTFNGGVNYTSRHMQRFRHLKAHEGGLNNPYILSITQDKNKNLWIGTDGGGLNYLDRKTGKFSYYLHDNAVPTSLSSNAVTCAFVDKNNQLWAGTYLGGLNRFNPKSQSFTIYQNDPDDSTSIRDNIVRIIFEDSQGQLLIGFPTGLDIFDRKHRKFSRFPYPINQTGVQSIIEDKRKNLWIGTFGGLCFVERATGNVINYSQEDAGKYGEIPTFVSALYEDSRGHIWIGSRQWLYVFDPDQQRFFHYSKSEQFNDNFITGILEDRDGNILFSTNQQVVKMVNGSQLPAAPRFMNLGIYDGLNGFYKSQDGEIFFGGDHGLNMFYSEDINNNPYVPPVVLTNFKIYNKEVKINAPDSPLSTSISLAKDITLSYRHSVITFEFAALNYIFPEKNQYAYIMEGFEDQCNYVGNQRAATYTNLDPGEYVFRVKASNNDGVWNEEGTSISVRIVPPWWETVWAYLAYIIILGFLFYSIWRFQLNKARMKQELALEHLHAENLEELNRMKTRFFTNVTHEFRTPLTLIMGLINQILESDLNERLKSKGKMILRNSQKLYHLINQLLDLSKLEAGSMSLHAQKNDIVSIIRELVSLFSSLAERKRITIKLSASNDNIDVYIDPDLIDKIFSNLLSNAIKFTPEGGNIELQIGIIDNLPQSIDTIPESSKLETSAINRILNKISKSKTGIEKQKQQFVPDFKNGYVQIIIKDTGIGCSEDELGKLFNRFYQIDDSHTRRHEGTGIGLALTKELVELHRGTISVQSQKNQGTQFTVRFPLGSEHLKATEIVENEGTDEQFGSGSYAQQSLEFSEAIPNKNIPDAQQFVRKKTPLILIVEDNSDLRNYLHQELNHDHQILEAGDGNEGIRIAIEQIPDLIVSDVMMPGTDGFELCRTLKTDERTSHIPIIMLTARATGESKIEGLETGADDYVTKPFDAKELHVRIKNLIEQRHRLQMRYNRKEGLRPDDIATTSGDQRFLKKALDTIEQNLNDPNFGVEQLARQIALSRVQLHRKIRALTGQSTSEFIRVVRLNRAAQLLRQRHDTVTQIAFSVGFNSSSYFSRSFYKHFGVSPSDYAEISS